MSTVAESRFTSADLELLQHDNKRYEIIDGELYVSTQPSWIADPAHSTIEVYRRQEAALHLAATLQRGDTLETPLLPGFNVPLDQFFGHS